MTDLIDAVQKQNIGSELISLYELTLDSSTLYFHPGLDENLDELYFEDATDPFKIREYDPFPISMTGVEFNADGVTNRPTLTVANVTTLFSSLVGGTNEDLIGQTVTVRQTLKQYLSDETAYANDTGTGSLPVEFPKNKFIIDRVSGETALSVTFELSSPYDLQGIKIPNRQVIGKYCSWVYQAGDENETEPEDQKGGCYWRKDSILAYGYLDSGDVDQIKTHKAYFTVNDIPLVPTADVDDTEDAAKGKWAEALGYDEYDDTAAVVKDYHYESGNTVWKALIAQVANPATPISPQYNSKYWLRAEMCGKKLTSCKCRFQFTPYDKEVTNSYPTTDKNTIVGLPFGAFPGTKKFR